MQRLDQRHHVQNRHSVAQHARNQLCIVPEFLVEQAGNTADGIRIAIIVGVLEIVALVAVGILDPVSYTNLTTLAFKFFSPAKTVCISRKGRFF